MMVKAKQVIDRAKELDKSMELDTKYWIEKAVAVVYEEKENELFGKIITEDGLMLVVKRRKSYDCLREKCYEKTIENVYVDSIHSSSCNCEYS